MDKDLKQRYTHKAKKSFNTKLNLYLFKKAIDNTWEQLSLDDFRKFEIQEGLINQYVAIYWQYEMDYQITASKTIKNVYEEITCKQKEHAELIMALQQDYVENRFPEIYPPSKFQELIASEKCEYCGIRKPEIEELSNNEMLFKKNLRGWTLEIDRKNSNREYSPDNCIMACYWCNNAKTDEFTHEEFKPVGQAIKEIWLNRMKSRASD